MKRLLYILAALAVSALLVFASYKIISAVAGDVGGESSAVTETSA